MDSDEDYLLISRAKQGDRAAYDVLYTKHKERLIGYCTRLMNGHKQDAEDAAQSTFIQAWTKLDTFRGEGRFMSWLLSIATDVCRKRWRATKDKVHISLDDPAISVLVEDQSAIGAKEVDHRLFLRTCQDTVREFAQTAKPAWDELDLKIFSLYYEQSVADKREVARRLGVNENTIKYRISRHIEPLFKKVREKLEDKDGGV